MKKRLILGIVFLLLLGFSSVAFAGAQDFTLINQTGSDIHYVFIAPHTSNDWGSDVMGRDVLPNGGAVDILFSPGEKATYWDIRVEYMDGTYQEWENFNLKQIHKITIKKNGDAFYE